MVNSERVSELKTELLNASMHLDIHGRKVREKEKSKKMQEARRSIELYRERQELRNQTEEFLF